MNAEEASENKVRDMTYSNLHRCAAAQQEPCPPVHEPASFGAGRHPITGEDEQLLEHKGHREGQSERPTHDGSSGKQKGSRKGAPAILIARRNERE